MRRPWTPSIVGQETDQTFYLVVDRFFDGPYFREVSFRSTDREEVVRDLAAGQYNDPLHVIAFNVPEGWSRVVSREIAAELQRYADRSGEGVPASVAEFIDRHAMREQQLAMKLA